MDHIFISHSTEDDEIVKNLRETMEIHRLKTWVDSRKVRPGDTLEKTIKDNIANARAFMVVLSPRTINSEWVPREIEYALEVKKQKDFSIIPVLLEGFTDKALGLYFKEKPVGLKVHMGPGGVSTAMPHILAALGLREPSEIEPAKESETIPMAELVLTLSRPRLVETGGKRRAQAEARLTYKPPKQDGNEAVRDIVQPGTFTFTAPMGPIEMNELKWYLEDFFKWPAKVFTYRAQNVEKLLPEWGKILYDAILTGDSVREIRAQWEPGGGAGGQLARRFTVYLDSQIREGGPDREAGSDEAATQLLALPWELLHDGGGYVFEWASPVRVRRRLPNAVQMQAALIEPPIRTLLVSPRPEDKSTGFFDHRSSALPLVSAFEELGDLAQVTLLPAATFPALQKELRRALEAGTPYHIVHFDGHGVYNKKSGLGGLCFEDPKDENKIGKRGSKIVDAETLARLIRGFRIPLVFLDACQTAQTDERPETSVAAALLNAGTASVVAMSHSVLVEAASRFVKAFYTELAAGSRVGKAMLAGQRELFYRADRIKKFGGEDLELMDWFVPVLYQEEADMQLMTRVPSRDMREMDAAALQNRFNELPSEPGHGFTGRSRELLKLERMLERDKRHGYAVICGQGGEGKTTLAAELARWLIRIGRFERGVFVCLEKIHNVRTVVNMIGEQLITDYTDSVYKNRSESLVPIESRLRDKRTVIVLDNMESIVPGPGRDESGVQAQMDPGELEEFFQIAKQLLAIKGTQIIFTSREALPSPFDSEGRHVLLGRLSKTDAIQLVHHAMAEAGLEPKEDEGETGREVEELVETVNCHARSLVLLAPHIKKFGVAHAVEHLSDLMAQLHKKYPEERERSLFASVELSLGRLQPGIREKIKPLGLFQGGGNIVDIKNVLELTEEERDLLARQLIETGLAEAMSYGFIRFHPALCPYLFRELEEPALSQGRTRWAESMEQLSRFLYQHLGEDAQLSAALTTLELPNLIRLLDHVNEQNDPGATVDLATTIEQLIARLGRPRLLKRVMETREAADSQLEDWGRPRFESWRMKVERLLGGGNIPGAFTVTQKLLDQCLSAGPDAYPDAEYDTAMAYKLVGQVQKTGGGAEAALQSLDEAYRRFSRLEEQGNSSAARMAAVALAEKGDCLLDLGRLDDSAAAYEAAIQKSETQKDFRAIAVGKGQLGTVRKNQKRYDDAVEAHSEALKIFEKLGEPASVATVFHQIGMANQHAGRFEAAEQAYRKALSIRIKHNIKSHEADSLGQLGNLYRQMDRLEDAVIFYRQAADKYVEIENMAKEGVTRNNLAFTLIQLNRYDDARREIQRAIECRITLGHTAQLWVTYKILCDLELAVNNQKAADQAREKAIQLYLAYRRDGGENHEPGGRLCFAFLQAIQENRATEIAELLENFSNDPETHPFLKVLISKLQAILAGSRDPRLAEDKELRYRDVAEILVLLEKMGKS